MQFFSTHSSSLPKMLLEMHDQSSGFGAAIRGRRRALGLKQVELAELAGCSTRFVHTVEAGKATARLDKLLDLLQVLGLGLRLVRGPRLSVDEPLRGVEA